MKKIMFFIPRMGGGGAERVVANLANEFDRRGDKVIIYMPTDGKSFYPLRPSVRIEGEDYFVSKRKGIRQLTLAVNGLRLWFAYKRKVNKEKPDAVISFLTETNLIALTHKLKNGKLIVSERSDPTQRSKFRQTLTRYLYPKADVLVCQSQKVADYFDCKNTVVIPNPIDKTILPKPYLNERRKVVSAVGRLMPEKNFANLIRAFSMLSGECSEYTLEIYGEGVLRNELEALIKKLNMSGRIQLMGARRHVVDYIKDTSVFVMSSDYEGYPNALAEAMAIGLPVISTDFYTGTAREMVGAENGLLVPTNDSKALSDAIEELLSDSDRRLKMSKENVKIREKLSVSRIADMWYEVME